MSWLGGPLGTEPLNRSLLSYHGSRSARTSCLDAGYLCLKPSVRDCMFPGGGDLSYTCFPVFPQLQSSSERETRWWQPCSWHPGPRWAVGPSSLPLSSFTLKKTEGKEAGEPCCESWRGPPCFSLLGWSLWEGVMWRDGVQRPGKTLARGRQRYSLVHSSLSCSTSRGLWWVREVEAACE